MKTLKIYGLIALVLLSILLIDSYLFCKVVDYSRLTTSSYYTQDAINTAIIYTIVQMVLLSLGSYFIVLVLFEAIKAEKSKAKTINKIEDFLERATANRDKTEKSKEQLMKEKIADMTAPTKVEPLKHEDIFGYKRYDKVKDINADMFERKDTRPIIYVRKSIKPDAKVEFLTDDEVGKLISYLDSVPETTHCTYKENANSIATWYYGIPTSLRLTNEVLRIVSKIRPNRALYSMADEGEDQYNADYKVYTDYAKGILFDTIEWFVNRGYTVK